MKAIKETSNLTYLLPLLVIVLASILSNNVFGQDKKLLFDTFHGQNPQNGETFNTLLLPSSGSIEINSKKIEKSILKKKHSLIIFSPTKTFLEDEKRAIIKFLKSGGSLLLIFDEERRTPLNLVGVNDIIIPFGMELTSDAPVRHNCGAVADSSQICAANRELPYSGGRSITGGNIISRVNDEGKYVHSAYKRLPRGGKIIVMSDGMAGLLMGRPDGERFHGTGPSDSKYWGKDSKIFMQEILKFLTED
jgi:hypothetical protein